jgi:peptidoglycan-associated lipoprotein
MPKLTTSAKLVCLSAVLMLAACTTHMMESAGPPPPPSMAPPLPPAPPSMAPLGPVVTPGSLTDFQQNVGDRVFFAYDRSDLDDGGRQTLQKQAAWLQRYQSVVLTLEGHCDERGTREYNLALGARRAQSAKDYLVSLGVSAARLETISYGKERPICVQSNEACWTQNRRGVSTIKSGSVS